GAIVEIAQDVLASHDRVYRLRDEEGAPVPHLAYDAFVFPRGRPMPFRNQDPTEGHVGEAFAMECIRIGKPERRRLPPRSSPDERAEPCVGSNTLQPGRERGSVVLRDATVRDFRQCQAREITVGVVERLDGFEKWKRSGFGCALRLVL